MKQILRVPFLFLLVLIACAAMAFVDAVMQPDYVVKSVIKLLLFLALPLLYHRFFPVLRPTHLFSLDRKRLLLSLLAGTVVFCLILSGFFLLQPYADFSGIPQSLTAVTGVTRSNFPLVALYISLVNSLLEEFFFRGFAFLTLEKLTSRQTACWFSAGAFAAYHIAIMAGWFALPLEILLVAGLFLGGLFLNWCAVRSSSILLPWLIHVFANFAINTVGLLLFAA